MSRSVETGAPVLTRAGDPALPSHFIGYASGFLYLKNDKERGPSSGCGCGLRKPCRDMAAA